MVDSEKKQRTAGIETTTQKEGQDTNQISFDIIRI